MNAIYILNFFNDTGGCEEPTKGGLNSRTLDMLFVTTASRTHLRDSKQDDSDQVIEPGEEKSEKEAIRIAPSYHGITRKKFNYCTEKAKVSYSDYPAFQIKHIEEFWWHPMKHVQFLITNNIQPLGYHPSGTYYRYLKNMDFVPYVRISNILLYLDSFEQCQCGRLKEVQRATWSE